MRKIEQIVVHCSATEAGRDFRAADLDRWHRERGFAEIGYHFVIGLDGKVETGRRVEIPGAHVSGHNAYSIGICLIGGLLRGKAAATYTDAQLDALERLLARLREQYPSATICGHRDLSPDRDGDGVVEPHEWLKECPCFDVRDWCETRGIRW